MDSSQMKMRSLSDTLTMNISTFLRFDGILNMDSLRSVVIDHVSKISVLHSVVVCNGNTWGWNRIPISQMNWDYHIRRLDPMNMDEINALMGVYVAKQLWRSPDDQFVGDNVGNSPLPPWRMFIVPLRSAEIKSPVDIAISIMDHIFGDGIVIMQMFFGMLDECTDPAYHIVSRRSKVDDTGFFSLAPLSLARRFRVIIDGLAGGVFLSMYRRCPEEFPWQVEKTCPLSPARTIASAELVDMSIIKETCKLTNCTVNDFVVATVTGCMRRYLEDKYPNLLDETLLRRVRAAMPYSPRLGQVLDIHDMDSFKTDYAFMPFFIPLEERTPIDRLFEVNRRVAIIMRSPLALSTTLTLKSVAHLPAYIMATAGTHLYKRMAILCTNVPGPGVPISMAGVPIKEVGFSVGSPFGLIFSIISYAGKLKTFITTDQYVPVQAKDIALLFHDEAVRLHSEVVNMDQDRIDLVKAKHSIGYIWIDYLILFTVLGIFGVLVCSWI